MSGKITRLVFQRHSRERVSVHLDGRYAFGVPALEAAKLKIGQVLSEEEIAGLREADARQRAYDRTLRLLAHRPRSEQELRRYLVRKETPPDVIGDVMERLSRQGYLDDAAFVHFWVDNRERHRPRGPRALRQELRQKGVAQRLIAEALAGLDWEDSAYRAGHRRLPRWAHLEYEDFRRAAGGYLIRRGFGYDVVRDTVERLWADIDKEADDEAGSGDES